MGKNIYDDSRSIKTWDDFINIENEFCAKKWLFRGEQKYSWELSTLLERKCNDYGISLSKLPQLELGIIREYYRQLSEYGINNISKYDYFRIMSLMQHFGCPTRLLDFSRSAYIALFFASEKACIPGRMDYDAAAIWIFNAEWLDIKYKMIASDEYTNALIDDPFEKDELTQKIILNDRKPIIKHIGPYEMNQRMVIQQGTFLIPLDMTISFMENIYKHYSENEIYENIKKIKIIITADFLKTIYDKLHKMNITRTTLFPGIDGFSTHFNMRLLLDYTINNDKSDFA